MSDAPVDDGPIPLPAGALILPDPAAVAREAAERLASACEAAPSERIAICLSGGSTPKLLYEMLVRPPFRERLPWPRIHWFFGDDRVVPWDDPASNALMVAQAFGPDAPVPAHNLYRIDPAGGPEAASAAYGRTLADFFGAERPDPARPAFDLTLLGLGEDGHTASLFPGKPALAIRDAWTAPVPEAGMAPHVPRVTLTFPALAASRTLLVLVAGAGKREPLRRLAAGEDLPAGRFAAEGSAAWLIDRAAAGI